MATYTALYTNILCVARHVFMLFSINIETDSASAEAVQGEREAVQPKT